MPQRISLWRSVAFHRLLGAAVALTTGWAAAAGANLRHGVVYYVGPSGSNLETVALAADRYEFGLCGTSNGDAFAIKELNPDFRWHAYNSVTDNYVDSPSDPEDALVGTVAAAHGWDHEEAYIHFYDDTRVTIQGTTVFVPGWGGGSAATKAEARVPVYYSSLSRRVVNFSTPEARQLNKEVIIALTLDRTFEGTDLHPDGILLDNSPYRLQNLGAVVEGGHVLETPGRYVVGSQEFQDWHWNSGLGVFLAELKDTLETSALWSPDGQRKTLLINIANAWTDTYVSLDVADILGLEWQYDPVRNPGSREVGLSFMRDRLAADGGIASFQLPLMSRSAPPQPGSIPYGTALLGSLAWNLASRTDETLLYLFGGITDPKTAGWDSLTWRGCVDVTKEQLGNFVTDPYPYQEGTDPLGYSYRIWARNYANGLVLVRNRGASNQGIEPATAVPVALPAPLASISPEGVVGDPTTSITLRNGEGAILLGDPGPPPVATLPMAYFTGSPVWGAAPLTVDFTDRSNGGPLTWSWRFGDGGTSSAQNPTHTYSSPGSYRVDLTITNALGSDARTINGYVNVAPPPTTPIADFVVSERSGAAPHAVAFTDLSLNAPTSWSWTFGDGATSTTRNPIHTYAELGTYEVSLTVTNEAGTDVETKAGYITVSTMGSPHADFSGTPASGVFPLTVSFTDASTNSPHTWQWSFGDGATSGEQNPSHTYMSPGFYTVELVATNDTGSDSETKAGYIDVTTIPRPVAAFDGTPRSGPAPLTVAFTDQSTDGPTSWNWDFGDGTTSTVQNPQHVYESAGSFTVTLTVANEAGEDTLTRAGYIATGGDEVVFVSDIVITEVLGARPEGTAQVTILNGQAEPVAGALVAGVFEGFDGLTKSGYTNETGTATIYSGPALAPPDSWCFEVTDVSFDGASYDQDRSVLTRLCDDWTLSPVLEMALNYPNPFTSGTDLAFSIPREGHVRVEVFSLDGGLLTLLLDERRNPGNHVVTWNAEGYPSGIYLVRLRWEDQVKTRRMTLVR